MNVITTITEYNEAINQNASMLLFSLPTCKPCKTLKEWLETNYSSDIHHFYYINADTESLKEMTKDIVCFPTVVLYIHSKRISTVEGFFEYEISEQITQLKQSTLHEPTSPSVPISIKLIQLQ
jgi:hypothetical protein